MNLSKELVQYCKDMLLKCEIDGDILIFDDKEYQIVDEDETIFSADFDFMPVSKYEVYGYVYKFGGRVYIQEGREVTLKEFKYAGDPLQKIPTESFLGVHSGNEILNGVGMYEDWIKKAKFLGVKNLGICEKNTLMGALDFQEKCNKENIKPIIGMTFAVKGLGLDPYYVKAYVKNFEGWQNLLKINRLINVEEKLFISENNLRENNGGLFLVLDPKSLEFNWAPDFIGNYCLDTVNYSDPERDEWYVNNLSKFIQSDLKPTAIYDAYNLEKNEWEVREKLWGIAKTFDYKSKNQFFKNSDQYAKEIISLFEDGNKSWIKLFKTAIKNTSSIVEECNFKYDTSSRHLPAYIMSEKESEMFKSNEELFIHLVKKGFKDRGVKVTQVYIDRLKSEIKVLKAGQVIDYFLTLYDIVKYAKNKDILVGIGRGSAGGSLVSYLLGIIQIDPIEFNLIFERFLNMGRMGSVEECGAFEIETDSGVIKLNEKSIIRVNRSGRDMPIFVEDLLEGDEITKY